MGSQLIIDIGVSESNQHKVSPTRMCGKHNCAKRYGTPQCARMISGEYGGVDLGRKSVSPKLVGNYATIRSLVVSPDGKHAAFSSLQPDSHIWMMEEDKGH